MRNRALTLASLFLTLFAGGFALPAVAQFEEDAPDEGFSENDGSPAERGAGELRRRGERGERGGRGERGEGGERGGRGPRPNPMFEVLDTDGDGMITARELRTAIKALKTLDADGDGNISLDEASPMRGPGGPGGPGGDPNEMIDRIMENDANGDGKLTRDEVDDRLAGMLENADTNGDGAVDRGELETAMQNMRGEPGGPGGGGSNFDGAGGGSNFRGAGGGAGGDPDSLTKQIMSADQNGDGMISASEMNPEMARRLQGADTNGDGALNAKEVRVYMETARQRMQQFRGQGGAGGRFDPRQRGRGREQEQEQEQE